MSTSRFAERIADRYRLERELGQGGMATVYLAEDVRHRRRVALKLLHPELSAVIGSERFLKEIELTASLQHPHILPLFDSGSADGQLYYVMPFIDGETLRSRLDRERQLSVDDALRIAREVADALQYAHERGIIHRDIKPENILLQGGHALVADFGIALALQQAGGQRMTQTGLSLGTPHYMAPEQAMGERTIDARADIYALGAITFEMLAGEPPFTAPTLQGVIARVTTEEARAVHTLRRTVPVGVSHVIGRSLHKLPSDRPPTARDFAAALQAGMQTTSHERSAADAAASRGRAEAPARRTLRYTGALAVLVTAAGVGYLVPHRNGSTSTSASVPTMAMLVPEDGEQWDGSGRSIAMSPDGRRVAVVSSRDRSSGLIIRSLDSLGSRSVPGTSGATMPFWSRDGASLAFFADGQLKVADLSSGAVRKLCAAPLPGGGSWGADEVILYVPEGASPVHRTSSVAAECKPLGVRQPPESMRAGGVQFLGDGRHFIVSTDISVWIAAIGDDSLSWLTDVRLHRGIAGGGDILLYKPDGTSGTLSAQRIDLKARRLTGQPVGIIDGVPNGGGYTAVTTSLNGSLVAFASRGDTGPRRRWVVTRNGVTIDSLTLPDGGFGRPSFSHDGQRIVVGGWSLSIHDRAAGTWTSLLSGQQATPRLSNSAVWAPNDTAVAFISRQFDRRGGGDTIMVMDSRGTNVHVVTGDRDPTRNMSPRDWSPDGRYLLFRYSAGGGAANGEPWIYDFMTSQRRLLFAEPADIGDMRISPDGRFIAYEAAVSREPSIFVRPFLTAGAAVRVSTREGTLPRWTGGEGDLVFDTPGGIMRVRIDGTGHPTSSPSVVFRQSEAGGVSSAIDVSPDGELFLVGRTRTTSPPLTLMLDWWSLLNKHEKN
ncbi:MAG: protein kinase [Gemmatimonas sp.]